MGGNEVNWVLKDFYEQLIGDILSREEWLLTGGFFPLQVSGASTPGSEHKPCNCGGCQRGDGQNCLLDWSSGADGWDFDDERIDD